MFMRRNSKSLNEEQDVVYQTPNEIRFLNKSEKKNLPKIYDVPLNKLKSFNRSSKSSERAQSLSQEFNDLKDKFKISKKLIGDLKQQSIKNKATLRKTPRSTINSKIKKYAFISARDKPKILENTDMSEDNETLPNHRWLEEKITNLK